MKKFLSLLVGPFAIMAVSCVTLNEPEKKGEAPKIEESLSTDKAVEIGLDYGGDTLMEVKNLLRKRKKIVAVGRSLEKDLVRNFESMPDARLINSISIYIHSGSEEAPHLMAKLVKSSKKLHRQLAWHIAAAMASPKMAKEVEGVLTKAITEDSLDGLFSAEMADALVNNKLQDSYTILVQGLMATNSLNFAQAMIAIAPEQAAADFMVYLAQAPVEELRQLSLTSVDLFCCMEMLKHLQKVPVSIYHPNFSHLFYYATSRNQALAELGQEVLSGYSPKYNAYLAYLFGVQPEWVQLAYIEGIRRNMTPVATLFLFEVKKNSRHQEIIDEINSMIN